jgi:hypothetical protein
MNKTITILSLMLVAFMASAQNQIVKVSRNKDGFRLLINDKPFEINGMNWDYYPIGTNYTYNLWKQPDDFIKSALDREMLLLKNMGVNAIRVYTGIPAKWITYIYENYGIYTLLNHTFGRYGLTINGVWVQNIDYSNAEVANILLSEVKDLVDQYKNTSGLLMIMLGNENNYGLYWRGAETESIPVEQRSSTILANSLYKLFNEAAILAKSIDKSHPIGICNGDLLFLNLITKECKDVDILGLNAYRGISFTDAFSRVKTECDKPIIFTEFGADAYNALNNTEDQEDQAKYLLANWCEIYQNAAGLGKAENCLGGFTFQFSDGWWKTKQTSDLDVHNTDASWANGGYAFDYKKGSNNINEEWFGICAKGQNDASGLYTLYPRKAYYLLKKAHKANPFLKSQTAQLLENYFKKIH